MEQTKLVEITDIEKQKAILEEAGQIIRDGYAAASMDRVAAEIDRIRRSSKSRSRLFGKSASMRSSANFRWG